MSLERHVWESVVGVLEQQIEELEDAHRHSADPEEKAECAARMNELGDAVTRIQRQIDGGRA